MTREEQIKVLKDWKPELELMAKYNSNSIDYQRYTALDMAIKALEQEPKTGHWEMCEDADGIYGVCDICGTDADFTHYGKAYPYCPNCGAKTERSKNEPTIHEGDHLC